jgi:hypothetical protein
VHAKNNTTVLYLVECDDSDDDQIWRYDERGYLSRKGANGAFDKCLYVESETNFLLKYCSASLNYVKRMSFAINDRHNTIVALAVKSGWAITKEGDGFVLKDYVSGDSSGLDNQWTLEKFVGF